MTSVDAFQAQGVTQTTTKCLQLVNESTTVLLAADLTSMDSDGFTLNYSTTDGTAKSI
jgi:hypothetical protein